MPRRWDCYHNRNGDLTLAVKIGRSLSDGGVAFSDLRGVGNGAVVKVSLKGFDQIIKTSRGFFS
jgi:hypothetical protein